ncbi:MAG: cupin domain-containing protein [Patescibacteria group bacterium]
MKGYTGNIETDTRANADFRRVLYTGRHSQLVLMNLRPGEEIGLEVHTDTDQFFRFETGQGQVIIDESVYEVADGVAVIVPAGAQHNVVNTGDIDLKLYTIYSPAHHKDGIVRTTKEDAVAQDAPFDGVTTE